MEDLNEMQNPTPVTEEAATNAPMTENSVTNQNPTPEPVSEPAMAEEPAIEPAAPAAETPAPEEQATEEPSVDYSSHSREELVDDLRELLKEDIEAIKNRVSQVRNSFNEANKAVQKAAFEAFLADGGNKDEYQPSDDAVAETFHKLYGEYRERRQKHTEEVDAQKQKNLEQKKQILDELKAVIDNEENLKKAYDDFNAIQERWKGVGEVPRENANDLWQNYHFLIEQFFNKVKINKELKMLDMKKNLEQKMILCEKAEELLVEPNIQKAFKGLQELRDQWKEIGPVPPEQNEEIWNRFCAAADQIGARHREYFDQRRDEMEKNLLAKQALIAKASELTTEPPASTKAWNDVSDELDELLKVWKTIGPVPREQNEEIWKQFKSMIDGFYSRKKEYFTQVKDEQSENYNKKIDLCLKAEAVAKREDWKKATEELLQLQAEWKNIGAVSRKFSDKIWQRFRGACDEFFAKKQEYFSHVRENEAENLAKKEAIIAAIKAFEGTEDRDANLNALKDFQRQWMEIGFVPMGEKERLKKEYRAALDAQFEKLKISAREAEETAYRERIRNAGADVKKFVNNEKDELLDKIEKLRNDLKLWENNLGFLNNSKQADLLKNEFEKKMQGARQQIALLEAKLRILRETEKAEKEENKAE